MNLVCEVGKREHVLFLGERPAPATTLLLKSEAQRFMKVEKSGRKPSAANPITVSFWLLSSESFDFEPGYTTFQTSINISAHAGNMIGKVLRWTSWIPRW